MSEQFQTCQPGQVQWRRIESHPAYCDHGRAVLWRTSYCNPTRWHYWENPCNCEPHRPERHFFTNVLEFELVEALPESGSWKRDGSGIAARVANIRAELAREREAARIYANCGPRELGTWDNVYGTWETFP